MSKLSEERLQRRLAELEAVLMSWVRYDEMYPDVLSGRVPQGLAKRMRETRAALNLPARKEPQPLDNSPTAVIPY